MSGQTFERRHTVDDVAMWHPSSLKLKASQTSSLMQPPHATLPACLNLIFQLLICSSHEIHGGDTSVAAVAPHKLDQSFLKKIHRWALRS